MQANRKPVELELAVSHLTFQWGDRTLVWDANPDTLCGPNVYRASGMYDESGFASGRWFVFYHEDCFQPAVYVIRADSFESAYESFIDEFATLVDEKDIETDYANGDDDRLAYANGRGFVDTEDIQGAEVTLMTATVA